MTSTRSFVEGFGPISADNIRTLLMQWLMEGALLASIGALVTIIAGVAPPSVLTASLVYRTGAAVLVVMAGVSAFTGARASVLPMKRCPAIFLIAAALFFIPTIP